MPFHQTPPLSACICKISHKSRFRRQIWLKLQQERSWCTQGVLPFKIFTFFFNCSRDSAPKSAYDSFRCIIQNNVRFSCGDRLRKVVQTCDRHDFSSTSRRDHMAVWRFSCDCRKKSTNGSTHWVLFGGRFGASWIRKSQTIISTVGRTHEVVTCTWQPIVVLL